jgi:hypothetical protein
MAIVETTVLRHGVDAHDRSRRYLAVRVHEGAAVLPGCELVVWYEHRRVNIHGANPSSLLSRVLPHIAGVGTGHRACESADAFVVCIDTGAMEIVDAYRRDAQSAALHPQHRGRRMSPMWVVCSKGVFK